MTTRALATVAAILVTVASLSSCGNTIRGVGRDTANAGRSVDRAARR